MKCKYWLWLLPLLLLGYSCTPKAKNLPDSKELKVEALTANTFVHVSYLHDEGYGKVACNGMVYVNGNEAIIFDTPTDNNAANELITWVQNELGKHIKAVVVTHFHVDCLGGLKAFHDQDIDSYAYHKTIVLAQENNEPVWPQHAMQTTTEFTIGEEVVHATFYGEGHTKDNIVGYIPGESTLFGGCLVKTLNASKGYLGDANVDAWPTTVQQVKADLPEIKLVIPGHGPSGDATLLDYTIELFSKS